MLLTRVSSPPSQNAARMARALIRAAVPAFLHPCSPAAPSRAGFAALSTAFGRTFHGLRGGVWKPTGRPWPEAVAAQSKNYRKVRRKPTKNRELELNVSICIEEGLPDDDSELMVSVYQQPQYAILCI